MLELRTFFTGKQQVGLIGVVLQESPQPFFASLLPKYKSVVTYTLKSRTICARRSDKAAVTTYSERTLAARDLPGGAPVLWIA